ncbi:FUSC family protein [Streptomyces sp. TLI_171]|uniref:FUSC family protein n=1 Tax=Streptomyces sp. TLI_171 TaxID=1938859 RepID=UPI00117F4870|nr:FUSC family protein [Streptomyces sp. TLI_171]
MGPDWLTHPLRWQRGPVPWAATVRGAAGMAVPLGVAVSLGRPAEGVLAGLGAMFAGVNDRPGGRRSGVVQQAGPALGGALGLLIGVAVGWWAVPLLAAVGLVCGAISVAGPVASATAVQLMVLTVLGCGMPVPLPGWAKAACYLAGAGWLLVLRQLTTHPRPRHAERHAVAAVFDALAAALDAAGTDRAEAARRQLTAALDRAGEALRPGRPPTDAQRPDLLRIRLAAASALCEAGVALLHDGRPLPARLATGPRRLADAVRADRLPGPLPVPVAETPATAAFDLAVLHAALAFGTPAEVRPAGTGAAVRLRRTVAGWVLGNAGREQRRDGYREGGGAHGTRRGSGGRTASPNAEGVQARARQEALRASGRRTASADAEGAEVRAGRQGSADPGASGAGAGQGGRGPRDPLRGSGGRTAAGDAAGADGPAGRGGGGAVPGVRPWGRAGRAYGMRVAVCVAASAALALVLRTGHWYWLPVTAAFLVKPDYGPLFSRVVNRFAGTVAGVVLVAVSAPLLPEPWWPVGAVAVAGALIPVAQRHFAAQTAVITVTVLAFVTVGGDHGAAPGRLTDTALACLLVLLVGHLPGLADTRARVGQRAAHALRHTQRYLDHVLTERQDTAASAAVRRAELRRTAYRTLAQARAAAETAAAELRPGGPSGPDWLRLTVHAERLADAATAYAVERDHGAPAPTGPAARTLTCTLADAADALDRPGPAPDRGETPDAALPPELDDVLAEVRRIRALAAAG